MTRETAVVIAPGRGTYNATELGYLRDNAGDSPLSPVPVTDPMSTLTMSLEVRDRKHLADIIRRVRTVNEVVRVHRPRG